MTEGCESASFALLDDCDSTASARSSRLYSGFVHERVCTDPARLDEVDAALAQDLRDGLHAVVVGDYEFGRNLQRAQPGDAPLRFLLYARCERLSRDEADAWLAQQDGGGPPSIAGVAHVAKSVSRDAFDAAIAAVHDALRAGDSYQINYTYRLNFDMFGTPLALYRRLRARQPVRYGALIALPDGAWVVSCSPELFVEKHGDVLRARPMKGTAPRSADPHEDAAAAAFLANDPKNRAENVMIVDLLRNDVSRIARTGSVKVPALFSVEPYASVWQMTSTVEAGWRDGTTFAQMLRALFPCGSITGAPKHKTMELIDAIEATPRGLYTGAIGWLDAPHGASSGAAGCGDFCLSVAIRTLMIEAAEAVAALEAPEAHRASQAPQAPQAPEAPEAPTAIPPLGSPATAAAAPHGERAAASTGRWRGTMGVGAGIVLDSVAADEYAECELKARFLTDADPGFRLFETTAATRATGIRHVERHLARLQRSADAFGFRFDAAALRRAIDARCAALDGDGPYRMKLALAKDGTLEITVAALQPLPAGPVGVMLASAHGFAPTRSADALLLHKTTHRAEYDRAWQAAEALGGFDMLFVNERGEVTEGGRSNLFVKLDGRWVTPPLASGVLPGVMRGVLLDDPAFDALERIVTRDDLARADALLLTNALRGALDAVLK
ncbi:TPA: bifunctional anthranilate synthase component I family protein/class IV aminotransferase [Burkholderia vietnamiensis]|uniref:Bifunctional anthranilate synthase component I family protein/class IV aminotransferase n=1 Tax=Burkholderia vietnamiensis TaxID=60552 RepID=A0ABS1AZN9_BURVI|nr:bifunctional anthranilate synthase component I family protein/class IV aminotransferase [Burkholderia vietnamiensis]MBJ9689610.1 bifunctional anthranilate synthase component I family protein/class IV aminotransferase [Burkholderia vietnamiensis]HEP6278904.1 bifunctional anthranilate synthase component I family protein/class IV aminotransferase [Burkholderia vietnamiensis]HEP6285707.1 bifunctional anthranilate synthase component I family protein/class IV aminotransferase [Burkholderia vietnami